LRKAQDAAESARPYSERINGVIANLANSMSGAGDAPELLVGNGQDKTVLLIVATADRGLCGGFNTNIVRKAREEIVALEKAGKTVKLFLIGKKGYDQLNRLYSDQIVQFISLKEERKLHAGIARMKRVFYAFYCRVILTRKSLRPSWKTKPVKWAQK